MAVYTHFGGLPALVRAVVQEGFTRLATHLERVPQTSDPLHDLAELGAAYRANALENPELYAVMFGSASLGGYRLTGDELHDGRYTFDVLVAATARAIDAGVLRANDPEAVAAQLWSALHGYVMLEHAGFFGAATDEETVLVPLMSNLVAALIADQPRRRRTRAK